MRRLSVVDLCCGPGSAGSQWVASGFDVIAAIDSSKDVLLSYVENVDVLPDAVKKMDINNTKDVMSFIGCQLGDQQLDVLFINPPSSVSAGVCISYICALRPRFFVIAASTMMFSGKWFLGKREQILETGYHSLAFPVCYRENLKLPHNNKRGILIGISPDYMSSDKAKNLKRVTLVYSRIQNEYAVISEETKKFPTVGSCLGNLCFSKHYYLYPRDARHQSVFPMNGVAPSLRRGCLNGIPSNHTKRAHDSGSIEDVQVLTPMSVKRIQGLNDAFVVIGSKTSMGDQLCNLLPQLMIKGIAFSIKSFIMEHDCENFIRGAGDNKHVYSGFSLPAFQGYQLVINGEKKAKRHRISVPKKNKVGEEKKGKRRRLSRLDRFVYAQVPLNISIKSFEKNAKKRNIRIITDDVHTHRRRTLEYTFGDNPDTDARAFSLTKWKAPIGWTLIIKERVCQTSSMDDISWRSISGKTHRLCPRNKIK